MLHFGNELGGIRLWEMDDEALMGEVRAGHVQLKGLEGDEAVLCSSSRTYAVRSAESTNTLLLVAPHEPGAVCGMLSAVLEVRPCRPRLGHLWEQLGRWPYRGRVAEAAVDRTQLASLPQLRATVQCSEAELAAELGRLCVADLRGAVRLVEPEFEHRLMDLLLAVALENGWRWEALPASEAEQLLAEECDEEVTRAVLAQYGTAATGGGTVRLDARKVALLKARFLLLAKPVWIAAEFLAALGEALPQSDYFAPLAVADCFGFAIVEEKGALTSVRHFALDRAAFGDAPEEAFAQLFAARPTWPLEQIAPFVQPLTSPAMSLDLLLLRHCYVNRMDPKNVTVSKR